MNTVSPGKFNLKVPQFMIKNKRLAILVAVALVLLIIGVVVLIKVVFSGKQDQTAVDTGNGIQSQAGQESKYTFLPETERKIENGAGLRDPFAGALSLKGIMLGGGKNLAIIETVNTSYVAEVGTVIEGWTVTDIKENSVILASGDRQLKLEFNGRSKTEKIAPVQENKGDATGNQTGAQTGTQNGGTQPNGNKGGEVGGQ
ncbi:MAG: hypothetical protein ACOY31_05710 [Bacillota bacterium]